mmetsp:Transcript_18867/g.29074  ORF Transcript_18867/g.29074 Transcript_18867/m.29074 type:complete len:180 (-) Transcript_18867:240-779(-)
MSKHSNNSPSVQTISNNTQTLRIKPGSQKSADQYSKEPTGHFSNEWKAIHNGSTIKSSLWYDVEKYLSDIIVFLTISFRFDNILYNVACFAEQYIFSFFPALSELILIDNDGSEGVIPCPTDPTHKKYDGKGNRTCYEGNVSTYIGSKYTVLSPATVKLVESEDQSNEQWGHFAEFVDY